MSWLDKAKALGSKVRAYGKTWDRKKQEEQRSAEKAFEALPRWMRHRKVKQLTKKLSYQAKQKLLNEYADHRRAAREFDKKPKEG